MSFRCRSFVAFLAASFFFHGFSFAADWPLHRGNEQRTGASRESLSLPIELKFSVSLGELVSSPVRSEGMAFVGTGNNQVVALEASTGRVLWRFYTEGKVYATPAVKDGRLYVASTDGNLYALDARSGSLRWRFSRAGTHISSPLVAGGRVYFGTGFPDTSVYGLDAASGALKWEYKLSQPVYSSAAHQDGRLLIGANDGNVYIFDAATGALQNTFATGGEIYLASPAAESGRFYIAAGHYRKEAYAADLGTGQELWRHTLGGSDQFIKISSPALSADTVFISAGQSVQKLYALDKTTGSLRWQKNLGNFQDVNYLSSPVVAGDKVLVGSASGVFYILSTADGSSLFEYNMNSPILASPAVANGMVYVASYGGNLFGFAAPDAGSPQASLSSPAAGGRVNKVVEIKGTAYDENFQKGVLSYEPASGRCEENGGSVALGKDGSTTTQSCRVEIATFYAPVSDGTLGFWDTSQLADGDYLLLLDVYDAYTKSSAHVSVTLDNTPPSLQVDAPADGLLTNQSKLEVTGKTDAGAVVRVGETQVSVDTQGGFSHLVSLTEGESTVTVTAYDNLQNSRTISRSVTVDTTPPGLEVTSPADGTVTNQGKVTLSGKTEAGGRLTLDGQSVSLGSDGSFSVEKTLREGENTLTITATDRAGNQTSLSRKVVYDPNAPDLTLETPAEGLVTNQKELSVRGKSEAGVTVSVNGQVTPVAADGTFSLNLTLTEGENRVEVTATDRAGNQAKQTRTVTLDTIAPSLSLSAPADGLLTNVKEVEVSGTAEVGSSVTVGGLALPLRADGTFATTLLLSEGENKIEVRARDQAGNETTLVRRVTLDTLPPELSVGSPADGLITNQPTQIASGATEAGAVLTVNGASAAVGEDGSFTVTLTLAEGANTLEVAAEDPAGNRTVKTVTVVVDTIAPSVRIMEPFTPWLVDALEVQVPLQAQDNEGGSGLQQLFLSESEGFEPSTACPFEQEGEISCAFTLSDQDGAKTLHIEAKDRAGNRAAASLQLYLDRSSFARVPLSELGGEVVTGDGTRVVIPQGALKVKGNADSLFLQVRDPLKLGEALPPADEEVAKPLDVAREVLVVDAQGAAVEASLSAPARIVIPLLAEKVASARLEQVRVYALDKGEAWELLPGVQQRVAVKQKGGEGIEARTSRLGLFRLMEVVVGEELLSEVFNFPNPFSGEEGTTLNYKLREDAQRVEFAIYTTRGRQVVAWQVLRGEKGALIGRNRVKFSGTGQAGRLLPNGVYLYSVKVTGVSGRALRKVGKLVVLR